MNRATIHSIVADAVRTQLELDGSDAEVDDETTLLGADAVIDSLGLVNVVMEIEQALAESHDTSVILVDERAMSQSRSPFRSVVALVDYTYELATEPAPTT